MKILIRGQKDKEWHLVESAAYGNETELQQLLAESPSLISLDEVRPNPSFAFSLSNGCRSGDAGIHLIKFYNNLDTYPVSRTQA